MLEPQDSASTRSSRRRWSTIALFLLGYALQRGLINRFIARPDHEQFLLLLAIATIITASLLMVFGPDARNVQLDYAYDFL